MSRDTYEGEEDNSPTLCAMFGHKYKRESSETKTWKEEESYEITRGNEDYGEDSGARDMVYGTRTVWHQYEEVTYKCLRCEGITVKTENETSWY